MLIAPPAQAPLTPPPPLNLQCVRLLVEGKGCSADEAGAAVRQIMSGEGGPALTAAFLTALRWDRCTPAIVASVARSMRSYALKCEPKLSRDDVLVDVVGTGGDGFDTFNVSTAASLVVAASGAKVLKHGNRSNSSKCGSADILEALGANIRVDGDQACRVMSKCGFCFLFAQTFHPSMRFVAPVRRSLGVRTVFNILGPLTNPARPTCQMSGVFDKSLGPVYASVFKDAGMTRAMVVHSFEGLDELSPAGPSYAWILDKGKITERTVAPEDFGLPRHALSKVEGSGPERNKRVLREILEGKEGPCTDFVVLNAAASIWVAGLAPDFKAAAKLAQDTIRSKKAAFVLDEYIRLSCEEGKVKEAADTKSQDSSAAAAAGALAANKAEMSILHKIAAHRVGVIAQDIRQVPYAQLFKASVGTSPIDVLGRIETGRMGTGRVPDLVALMAEIKRASPSKGAINMGVDVPAQALEYARAGASVISVLTEPNWFKGTIRDLRAAAEAVAALDTPPAILLKDFVVDEYQILRARANGASTVLLIVTLLPEAARLRHFIGVSRSLGMEPLVEIARESEAKIAVEAGARFVGINNRNLKTFKVDMGTTGRLTKLLPRGVVVAALSGIKTRDHVKHFADAGARAVLVGETLMRSKDVGATIRELVRGQEQ